MPTSPLIRPHNLTGVICGSTIIDREKSPDPPMPWSVRKAMSWMMSWASPAAREKPAKKTQARMLAALRPMPSLMRANITEKPGLLVLVFGADVEGG